VSQRTIYSFQSNDGGRVVTSMVYRLFWIFIKKSVLVCYFCYSSEPLDLSFSLSLAVACLFDS
jgi:hypothetical protein